MCAKSKNININPCYPLNRILNTARHDKITPAESKAAIRRAFKTWSDVTPLIFREVNQGFADIYLKFGTGYHSDQYPFDGYGGTLAHAYPPMSGFGDLDGDVHFDDSEPFTVNTVDGETRFYFGWGVGGGTEYT